MTANNVVRLPTTATMLERAQIHQDEQFKALAKVDWNARAALEMSEKGNHSAARRFIRHILATTTGQS